MVLLFTGGGGFEAFKSVTQWINITGVCSGEWSTSSGTTSQAVGEPPPPHPFFIRNTHTWSSKGTDTSLWGRLCLNLWPRVCEVCRGDCLGMRLIFPSGFPRVAMASERLSVWKWDWFWVRGIGLPGQDWNPRKIWKLNDLELGNHLGEDAGPFAEKQKGNLSQRGVGVDLTPGTGSFSDLHRTSANTHLCSSHPVSAASK